MKQISRVLSAVEEGCFTSDQVEAVTGISRKAASSYLSELTKAGLIKVKARAALRMSRKGPAMNIYEMA